MCFDLKRTPCTSIAFTAIYTQKTNTEEQQNISTIAFSVNGVL